MWIKIGDRTMNVNNFESQFNLFGKTPTSCDIKFRMFGNDPNSLFFEQMFINQFNLNGSIKRATDYKFTLSTGKFIAYGCFLKEMTTIEEENNITKTEVSIMSDYYKNHGLSEQRDILLDYLLNSKKQK